MLGTHSATHFITMKLLEFSRRVHWAVIVGCCAASIPMYAEFIQPVSVQASNGEATQESLIDGWGLDIAGVGSPEALHDRVASEMWSGVGSIKADVTFDLGKTVDLTKVYIWNYNVANNTDMGMKEVEVLVSSETDMATANFTGIAVIHLKEGGAGVQVFEVVGTTVRLVKLRGISNWGHGWAVGLAEVRFESGTIAGDVPSIVINSPREGDVIPFGTDVTIDARVTDRDNNLEKVEFFDGETQLGEKTSGPFTWVVTAPARGEHAFRVVATDRSGYVGWATVNCSVRELVADRIQQIDDTEDMGDGLYQIQYTGAWNLAQGNANDPRFKNNDHYSDARNAYFEVRFIGVKIDIFATAKTRGQSQLLDSSSCFQTIGHRMPAAHPLALTEIDPVLLRKSDPPARRGGFLSKEGMALGMW
jgi:hypothetical protein